jgi:hypothetical protein
MAHTRFVVDRCHLREKRISIRVVWLSRNCSRQVRNANRLGNYRLTRASLALQECGVYDVVTPDLGAEGKS